MTDTESIVRSFYAALGRGDLEAAFALLDKQVKWTEAERSPYYAGEVTGVYAIVDTVLGPLGRDFVNFAATPSDFLTQGDRTAAFGLYTGRFRPSGTLLRAPFVHLWTVRNGRLARFVQYTDSAAWSATMQSPDAETMPKPATA